VISLDFSLGLALPEHQSVALGPGRNHMHKPFLACLACAAQSLAVDGDNLARRQLGNRRNPGHETLFHLLGVERGKDPIESIVRRNAGRQGKKRLQPLALLLAVLSDVVPALGTAQHRGNGDQQDLFQQMFPVPLHARIPQLGKILQGIVHLPFSPIYRSLHIATYGHLYASALPLQPREKD
jgi:hypothetical protein